MIVRILHSYKKAEEWTGANSVLKRGEVGFESDTTLCKVGDGTKKWNELDYYTGDGWTLIGSPLYKLDLSLTKAYEEDSGLEHDKHRGQLVYISTGANGKETQRACMYLERTINGVTTCDLVPISYFADVSDEDRIVTEEAAT